MNVIDIKTRLTLRPNEAAALLGVSRRSVERMLRDGQLRSTKATGRLIVAADVLALVVPRQEIPPIAA
jgi:excisionase family DNA binding protein